MRGINNLTIEEYLLQRDIIVVNRNFKEEVTLNKENIMEHIDLIVYIHKVLEGYSDSGTVLHSTIGRKIEWIKVVNKKLERQLLLIENKKEKNSMEEFLLEYGEKILDKSKGEIGKIEKSNYLELIKRSMVKNEICIGKVDESNIRRGKSIEIGTLKAASYNLIEEDLYEYLRKIRRKNENINLDEMITYFVSKSNLDERSIEYIKSLITIPLGTLKIWNRYRINKKGLQVEEYLKDIKQSSRSEKIID